MEDFKTSATHLKDHVSDYVKTYVDLAKAKATKGASNAAAGIAVAVTIAFLLLFFMIFGFTALALWVGTLLHNTILGFACVAGFFLLLMIIILLSRKAIASGIRNIVIRKVYE